MSEQKIKAVLIGDANVGKSNIFSRLTLNTFDDSAPPTLGAAFKVLPWQFETKKYNVEIWDTAGQERYESLSRSYSRDAQIVILVYDISDRNSFGALKNWYKRLQNTVSRSAVFGIFANKSDLDEIRVVNFEEGELFAREIKALFKRTSAKDNFGIADGFSELCRMYLSNIGSYQHTDSFKVANTYLVKKAAKKECC